MTRILSKSQTMRKVRGTWRGVIQQETNKKHLYSALQFENTFILHPIFWDSRQPISQMKKSRKDEWPAWDHLVPKWQNYNSKPSIHPQRLGLFHPPPLWERTQVTTSSIIAQLLRALSRWETTQEMSHPPQQSSHLLGGVKQVFSPELHTNLGQEAKST